MSKKIAGLMMALAMGVSPALAQNAVCVEPVVPAGVDGTTATREQIVASIAAAKDFMAKSDVYQQCLADDLEAKKAAAAKANTPFDEQLHQVAMAKVAANQQAKDKLAADTNAQAGIYKQRVAAGK
jgi:hypothetical protein